MESHNPLFNDTRHHNGQGCPCCVRPNPAFERTSTSGAPRAALRYSASRGAPLVASAQLRRWGCAKTPASRERRGYSAVHVL